MDHLGDDDDAMVPGGPPAPDEPLPQEAVGAPVAPEPVQPVETVEAVEPVERVAPVGTDEPVEAPAPPPAPERRRGSVVLLGGLAALLLIAGVAIGYAVSRPTVSDLESRLSAAQSDAAAAKADAAGQKAQLATAQASLSTCVTAAGTATKTLASWSSYLDAVQQLYRAQSNAEADKALALMAKRYRSVVEQTVPTDEALQGCTETGKA